VPSVPGGASSVAEAGLAIQAQPPTMTMTGSTRFQPSSQISEITQKTFDSGPAEPAGDVRSPHHDEPLRAWPGNDLAKLQAAYPGSPAPLPFHSADSANQQLPWLQDRGLRFFLTSGDAINTVRLDRPFAGTVNGVHLGDRLDEVRQNLGSPGRDLGEIHVT
jgi:hypothetical protein